MQSTFKFLFALALAATALTAAASPADPRNGTEYLTLPETQNTDAGTKLEVTECCAYYCPHCHSYGPVLADWVKKQGANISFKRVHVAHHPSVVPQQRLYYTLESMGLAEQYHAKVFAAMHEQHLRLSSDEQVFDWAASAGIERAAFIEAYRSFGVQAKVQRARAMMTSYKLQQWPTVAIDGRFLTSPWQAGQGAGEASEAQQQQWSLQVMDFLVAKAKAEKK